jgi:hypothetical protein
LSAVPYRRQLISDSLDWLARADQMPTMPHTTLEGALDLSGQHLPDAGDLWLTQARPCSLRCPRRRVGCTNAIPLQIAKTPIRGSAASSTSTSSPLRRDDRVSAPAVRDHSVTGARVAPAGYSFKSARAAYAAAEQVAC